MTKAKKIISIIVCLLVLTVMVPIMIEYHNVSGLDPQFLDLQLFDWKQFSFLEFYLSRYIFWGALVLSTLIILSILVIAFYPKQHLEIELENAGGELKLKSSAIEGFVRSVVNENNFIKNPKVRVNSRKNKCLVYVEGEILPSDNIIQRTQSIKDEIGNGLTQFFGLNHGVKLDVSVKDYKPKKPTKKTVSRVK